MSSDSEDCTAVGKLFHTRAAVEMNARPPMVRCSLRGTSSMADDDSNSNSNKKSPVVRPPPPHNQTDGAFHSSNSVLGVYKAA